MQPSESRSSIPLPAPFARESQLGWICTAAQVRSASESPAACPMAQGEVYRLLLQNRIGGVKHLLQAVPGCNNSRLPRRFWSVGLLRVGKEILELLLQSSALAATQASHVLCQWTAMALLG